MGALLVKRLDDALRDGDSIRAIIRETGVNQNGKTPSITAPQQAAQEALIRQCYERVNLDPAQTTYVEAHGTGTPAGDPLEVGALAAALRGSRSAEHPLYLGSIKANIGHTEAASGVASIIKVALALEKGQIPPNTQLNTPNSELRLNDRNMEVGYNTLFGRKLSCERLCLNRFLYQRRDGLWGKVPDVPPSTILVLAVAMLMPFWNRPR